MPVAFLVPFPVILSYVQKDATTPNIVGPTMSEDVVFVLVMVCKRMQQLPTIFGPAVHLGKDTTHETFLNILILSWGVRDPNNVGRAVQTLCKRIQHCCATSRRSRNKRNVGSCSLKSLTRFKLRATACKRVCKRTQHVTPNNVASVCTGLYGACFLLLKSL